MAIAPTPAAGFPAHVETLIIGAGAGGIVAALAAREAGQEVLVLERDPVPAGSTALSAGLIPAAGTRAQAAAGIADTPDAFAADIMAKAHHQPDPQIVAALTQAAATTLDWLADRYALPFSVVDDFDYPGHSARRMHGLPTRAGRDLIDRLRATAEAEGIDVLCDAPVTTLFADGQRVTGVEITRPDGGTDRIGCARVILACNGFGGNPEKVAALTPAISEALYFGHDGNRGDALDWGAALGAATRHLGAYQGHGNVAHPHGILITWATMTEGGFQVNASGDRFWDESQGYSEAAAHVLAQPGGVAWAVFDARIAGIARQFEDFRSAEAQGAVRRASTISALADAIGVPHAALAASFAQTTGTCPFGRSFDPAKALAAPFRAVRVTGALFHTQGGLDIMPDARVKSVNGGVLPNLFAVGGAACGVSGAGDAGYLSGNGLLAAVVLGRIAGAA
ncbi:FAD-dependent oxidoreductase [Tropicimonas sp. S265A]|uniref:FAD-dependent oxidoreductase n=1 Tax=Tropicimonas sp. S265A TaxID=3415134 RepID=UPI003C7C7FFF